MWSYFFLNYFLWLSLMESCDTCKPGVDRIEPTCFMDERKINGECVSNNSFKSEYRKIQRKLTRMTEGKTPSECADILQDILHNRNSSHELKSELGRNLRQSVCGPRGME